VAVWIAVIYSTIPLARGIQRYIYSTAGKEFFTYLVIASVLAAICSILYVLIFRLRIMDLSRYAWLIISGGTLIYFTLGLGRHPEEAVHFLEYGVLTVFVYWALGSSITDRSILGTSVLIVALVGIMDEFIQWLLPSRVWDYRDIGLNALASAIFAVAIYKVFRPKGIRKKISKRSMRLFLCMLSLDTIVLVLCLLNTPERVRWYAGQFEFIAWLLDEEPMTGAVIKFGSVTFTPYTAIWIMLILLLLAWAFYWMPLHPDEKHKQ
jgi:hypothetical protein